MINWSYILMSERNLWRYLQRNLKDNKSLLMRVENSLYKGIPDVNYLIDGKELEKISKKFLIKILF